VLFEKTQNKKKMADSNNTITATRTNIHITYLEMHTPHESYDTTNTLFSNNAIGFKFKLIHNDSLVVRHITNIPVPLFRCMYHMVGAPWRWWQRQELSDEDLAKILHSPLNFAFVIDDITTNAPCGYVELELSPQNTTASDSAPTSHYNCEINYFGLLSSATGKGAGKLLLELTCNTAWHLLEKYNSGNTSKGIVSVNTCNLDHPSAIHVYKKFFKAVREEDVEKDIPHAVLVKYKIGL